MQTVGETWPHQNFQLSGKPPREVWNLQKKGRPTNIIRTFKKINWKLIKLIKMCEIKKEIAIVPLYMQAITFITEEPLERQL